MADQHWSEYLVREFPANASSTVELAVNPSTDAPAVVLLLSRLAGLVDALRETAGADEEPLLAEDPEALYALLEQLHHVRSVLQEQENRVLDVANRRGLSLAQLAPVIEVSSRETVSYRLRRIRANDD